MKAARRSPLAARRSPLVSFAALRPSVPKASVAPPSTLALRLFFLLLFHSYGCHRRRQEPTASCVIHTSPGPKVGAPQHRQARRVPVTACHMQLYRIRNNSGYKQDINMRLFI
ncbi:hypothetical protein EYF80_058382 [Liparis tanakae]|uniref:Uncharacterized protein n=1 Tax=Liparis tanakae TaxID=230148 RepID=A0A4Z2ERD2_9TELE|nr:hypothetical protein EYF80_058382 [Liparis tanakae]